MECIKKVTDSELSIVDSHTACLCRPVSLIPSVNLGLFVIGDLGTNRITWKPFGKELQRERGRSGDTGGATGGCSHFMPRGLP